MSNRILPALPGLSWNVTRRPTWNTRIHTAVTGREARFRRWSYPKWSYRLSYEVLRANAALAELQQLVGFFNSHGGSAESWLYEDPNDRQVTAQAFGQGDGTRKAWQLVRAYGGYTEPVFELDGVPTVFINGAQQTSFSLVNGLLTFATAPAAGAALTWTGRYFWRVRFLQDQLELNEFMRQLFELKSMEFITDRT
ncbi:DUF2460 domain-containing protein [Ideonella paludis]|uniref:DUF2460 domain-containing protein n=1 Tax=Ideonella paludis TaxID=1233411 RepID=A0ABS5DU52_9BURK|nr:DUF2460 domain-containing protein [Ideonella paludis]MBQ0934654.1 DUF2460 domain-containing protein [Ideonella paludis]